MVDLEKLGERILDEVRARSEGVPIWGYAEDGKTIVETHRLRRQRGLLGGQLVMQDMRPDPVSEMYEVVKGPKPRRKWLTLIPR